MRPPRPLVVGSVVVLAAAALAFWAVLEGRRQRAEIERALTTEAALLAQVLGPSLAAASAAGRELDEMTLSRLLDSARLLAQLQAAGALGPPRLERLADAGELQTVAVLGPGCELEEALGEDTPSGLGEDLRALCDGTADELVLSAASAGPEGRLSAAARVADGGAVWVATETSTARAFAGRLGVENLLGQLAGSGGVLYLAYREGPGPARAASWDGGPVPPPRADAGGLVELRGRSAFEVTVPVEAPAGRSATLRVGLDGDPLRRTAASAVRRSLLVGVVLVALGLTAATLAAVSRLRVREREEALARLAEAESARRRNERLAAAGALTSGLAHEVRSPLNAIALAAQRLERGSPEDSREQDLARRIRHEVRRLEGVLREFLELARPVSDRREPVELGELGREVVELLEVEAESAGVALACSGSAVAEVDREAVRRALINLVRNALEASGPGGRVEVAAETVGPEAWLRVLDDGPGLAPELGERVFEAFVTTRTGGTGLGLSLVRRVAEEHGGEVHLANRPNGGAEAVLTLPLRVGERAS